MRIIFHIGAGKTGSSAIQTALARNRAQLSERGYFVPPTDLQASGPTSGNQVFAFQNLKSMPTAEASDFFASRLQALVDQAGSKQAHTIVFSAENLSNPFEWAPVLRPGLEGHETSYVMYLRRQDEYLLSGWQQWGVKLGCTFEEWLLRHLGSDGDWTVPIQQWRSFIDNESIGVYDRNVLRDGDVAVDFLGRIGVDDLAVENEQVNPSYGIVVEELMLSAPQLFENVHDNRLAHFLDRVALGGHTRREGESRLSLLEKQLILRHYAEGNTWIREHCFDDDSLPPFLFRAPADTGRMPSDNELLDQKFGLLLELILGEHLDRLDDDA